MELFFSELEMFCLELKRVKNQKIINVLEKNICPWEAWDFRDA